jgi:hypothetical protein
MWGLSRHDIVGSANPKKIAKEKKSQINYD